MTGSDGLPNRSEVVAALRDLKSLLDMQKPSGLFHPGGIDARQSVAYQRAGELLERFEAPKEDPAVALWLVRIDPDGVWLRRLGGDGSKSPLAGHVIESYTYLPPDRAVKAMEQVIQGFEPPRHLFRSERPAP